LKNEKIIKDRKKYQSKKQKRIFKVFDEVNDSPYKQTTNIPLIFSKISNWLLKLSDRNRNNLNHFYNKL